MTDEQNQDPQPTAQEAGSATLGESVPSATGTASTPANPSPAPSSPATAESPSAQPTEQPPASLSGSGSEGAGGATAGEPFEQSSAERVRVSLSGASAPESTSSSLNPTVATPTDTPAVAHVTVEHSRVMSALIRAKAHLEALDAGLVRNAYAAIEEIEAIFREAKGDA